MFRNLITYFIHIWDLNSAISSVSYQTQVLDCQFQMRMVWSSEALRIHGYSYGKTKHSLLFVWVTGYWFCKLSDVKEAGLFL